MRINPQLLEKIRESLSSVLPITAIVLLLSITAVPLTPGTLVLFLFGAVLLIVGLGVFTLGVDLSMTPMGSGIGVYMSRSRHMAVPLAAAFVLGIPAQAVRMGLEGFFGAGRRFEFKGQYNGAKVYDDYAHHPDELHALLTTAKSLGYRRLIVAFQPHTYSRTAKLFDRFAEELKLADVVVLAEIYAAREQNTAGISSRDLAQQIPGSLYCATLDETARTLRGLARPGDIILTVGAGDIYTAGEALVGFRSGR